jgi:integrase
VSAFLKEWKITLHGLRHSHAGYMLASNIHPKIVQEAPGAFLDRDHDEYFVRT